MMFFLMFILLVATEPTKAQTYTPSNDTYLLAKLIPTLNPLNNYMFDGPAEISQAPTSTKTITPNLDQMMYYNYYAAAMYCQYYLEDLSCVFCDKFSDDVSAHAGSIGLNETVSNFSKIFFRFSAHEQRFRHYCFDNTFP